MDAETQTKIRELEQRLQELADRVELVDKQQIKIVGSFDGTNVPVTITGIRRKIATTTP